MGYADKIGGESVTVGDAVKARQARLAEAEKWLDQHPAVGLGFRLTVTRWIENGGPRPWETPDETGAQPYPPQPTQ